MCGSGTTLIAAKLLQRHWIGIDVAEDAIELANARLDNPQKTMSHLLEVGKEAYLNQDDKTRNLLDAMNALIVQRNNGLDGFSSKHITLELLLPYVCKDTMKRLKRQRNSFYVPAPQKVVCSKS